MTLFQKGKLLSGVCTLGVGGPAKYFVEVRTIEQILEALKECRKKGLRFLILGKGSNTLFDDRGFNGAIILNKIDFFEELEPGLFHVGAGYSFSLLGVQTARKGWSGLEFASGIPGTVGGAVFMNAGANGMETQDSLVSVDYVDEDFKNYTKEELNFSYRNSSFHEMAGAIVGATFRLEKSEEARKKQIDIITYRKETQPYGEKSAGCMFRNPKSGHAGALIEKCGLKKTQIGGAQVSELHANFIVNRGEAKSQDILRLIEMIQKKVNEETGVTLESEVRVIPYE